jgi:uncharacterized protein YndB with AHSA1/START domain
MAIHRQIGQRDPGDQPHGAEALKVVPAERIRMEREFPWDGICMADWHLLLVKLEFDSKFASK